MKQKAFSLVELSIVLVILGLLTGGILAGKSLIRASELRSVSTEFSRYRVVVQAFRDKYFALPGDINNAVSIWGTASACPGVQADARTSIATCNGNGNGMIENNASTSNERFGFWQHLANAGLIEGSYAGVTNHASTASNGSALAGFNIPASKAANASWYALYEPDYDVTSNALVEGTYGNLLEIANWVGASPNVAFAPEEAWNIDTKLDDGMPGQGIMVVRESHTSCYDLSDGSTGSASTSLARNTIIYNLNGGSTTACTLIFRRAF